MSLSSSIREKAVELGFDLVGIAPATVAKHAAQFTDWLAKGYNADMSWMERAPQKRIDPRQVLDGAKSVICVGTSYFTQNPPPEIWDDPSRGRIARYAWGPDYHNALKPRLQSLKAFVQEEAGGHLNARYYVDSGPLLEHDIAESAGLGFVGRNSLLITRKLGSYAFLSEILLNIELEYDTPSPLSPEQKCGACQRCLSACPTQAFPREYVVDGNRCISYQTIENKRAIPEELRPLMKNWIFGCDACQMVCPWVKKYSEPHRDSFLHYDPDIAAPRLLEVLALSDQQFRDRFRDTPMIRTKRRGLLRNACIALGNWGSNEALPVLKKAAHDSEPLIRDHAQWAIDQIRS